jgi:hypothetical protein
MTTLAQANTSFRTKATTIASLAMAAMITVTAGAVSTLPASDPAWNAPTQFGRPTVAAVNAKSQPRSEERNQLGALEASRVIPCMMPRAWQRDCQVPTIKIAAN